MNRRYCEMCDKFVSARQVECKDCGARTVPALKPSRVDAERSARVKERLTKF